MQGKHVVACRMGCPTVLLCRILLKMETVCPLSRPFFGCPSSDS